MPKSHTGPRFNLQEALVIGWQHYAEIAAAVLHADLHLITTRLKRCQTQSRTPSFRNIAGYCVRWRSSDRNSGREVLHGLTFLPQQREIHYASSRDGEVVMKNITSAGPVEGNLMLGLVSTKANHKAEIVIAPDGIHRLQYWHDFDANTTASLVIHASYNVIQHTGIAGDQLPLRHVKEFNGAAGQWCIETDDGATHCRYFLDQAGCQRAIISPFGANVVSNIYKEVFRQALDDIILIGHVARHH